MSCNSDIFDFEMDFPLDMPTNSGISKSKLKRKAYVEKAAKGDTIAKYDYKPENYKRAKYEDDNDSLIPEDYRHVVAKIKFEARVKADARKKARDEKYKDWPAEFPEDWKSDSSDYDEVSFGSSKGSMVETMVYDNFVPEEPEDSLSPASMEIQQAGPLPVIPQNPMQRPPTDEIDTEKVRVSYFTGPIAHCAPPICSPQHHPYQGFPTGGMMGPATKPYSRQASVESGWDNPFRPDGDLSREADEIVSLIKGGKPITPTPPVAQPQLCLDEVDETPSVLHVNDRQTSASKAASPQKSLNGTKNGAAQIEVQKSPEPQQPEHVTIKKKPKCECCVLQ